MTKEFVNFVKQLIEANPNIAEQLMTDNIRITLNELDNMPEKPPLTDNGKIILKVLQENFTEVSFKSAEVAEIIGMTGRGVSGALRKLVTDGFCDKVGKDPIIYTLTEKGKNFVIED